MLQNIGTVNDDRYHFIGYKFKLYPTNSQKEFIDKCINTNRFIYNWALNLQNIHYKDFLKGKYKRKFYTTFELEAEFTKLRNNPEFNWLLDIPYTSARNSVKRLQNGLNKFFKRQTKFPKFKNKRYYKQSYTTRADRMHITEYGIKIEGLSKYIDIGFIPDKYIFTSKIYNPVIIKDNCGTYWITFSLYHRKKVKAITFDKDKDNVIGIDLNVKDRFVCSNGYRSGSPNIEKYRRRFNKFQRRYSKDIERKKQWEKTNPEETYVKSKRELKREKRYKKARKKIANVVENFIQVETKRIIDMNPSTVVMEHMNNNDILQIPRVAKLTYDAAFYRCRQVMQNKCNKFSIPFILAPRSYPSSQLCSNCGSRYKIGTSKIYKCKCCGLEIDRDLNAALNLKKLAYA